MKIFNAIQERPKHMHFESQEAFEKVHFLLRRHPVTNVGWMFGSIILAFLPFFGLWVINFYGITLLDFITPKFEALLLVLWYTLTMFFAFQSFLIWYFNVYIITDKRVIDVDFAGFWSKRISEAALGNVEDASYETNKFLHILFDYGDIFIQTAAEETEFEFHSIPKPGLVHDKLTDLVDEYKRKYE